MKFVKIVLVVFFFQNITPIICSDLIAQNRKINDDSCLESYEFLKSNIEYFNLERIEVDSLSQMSYYKSLLLNHTINKYLTSDFKEGHFRFAKRKVVIKGYGCCSVGVFRYLDYVGPRQSCDFIFINRQRQELSIWHYSNMRFQKKNLVVDFNTRGRHSLDTIIYLNRIKQFTPICYGKAAR
jgi:hypothetical protein